MTTGINSGSPSHLDGKMLKNASGLFQPDVFIEQKNSEPPLVVKTYRGRPWVIRVSWGRLAISREALAYSRLMGLDGVPAFVERRDIFTLVTSFVEAHPLPSRRNPEAISPEFFDRVRELYRLIHLRGVAHGDVRRHNILQRDDGSPVVLDFQTAAIATRWPGLATWFRFICCVDLVTVTKIKSSYFPTSLSAEEVRELTEAPWLLRVGRSFRKNFYSRFKTPNRERKARHAAKAKAAKRDRP